MKYALIGFNCRFTHSCLSLFYLRNELKKHAGEIDISLYQYTINDPYYATLARLGAIKADAYFFSVYIWNADRIIRITRDLSIICPSARFILGGPQIAALQLEVLPPQTTLVAGEIEGIDPSFYTDLRDHTLRSTYRAAKAKNFPSPYEAEDFDKELANRHIYYESSRGCPYSCTYCLSSSEPGVRNKPVDQVKEELMPIIEARPQKLRFIDRTFNASAKRTLEIWNFLQKESNGTSFHFEISPDLFSEEMFSFLASLFPGFFQFEIGIQSTNQETLDAISRKTDLDTSFKNIRRLVELDTIHIHIDLILGLPHETFASFGRSFDDIFSLLPHYIQMGLLKILPDTPLSKQTGEFSIRHCAHPPYEVISTRWMNNDKLTMLYWFGECVESFYNNRFFRTFFRYLRDRSQNGFRFFLDLLNTCMEENFFGKARTQRLMSKILYQFIESDAKGDMLQELLRYDWLRSGHRFLPDHLNNVDVSLKEERDRLWKTLPQNYPPLYTSRSRNSFLKQSLFVSFSGRTLQLLGFRENAEKSGILCFLQTQEATALALHKVVFFP